MKNTYKKPLIICLSLMSLIVFLFLFAFIYKNTRYTFQKEEERIIKDFNDNKQIFITLKDYLDDKYKSNVYINAKNLEAFIINDVEHEYFNYIFKILNYTRIEYSVNYFNSNTIAIRFVYDSRFDIAREIVFIDDNDIFWEDTGSWVVEILDGWYLWSFGYV